MLFFGFIQHHIYTCYKHLNFLDFHLTGFVEFFFVDTTPFVNDYFTDPGESTYDWKGILPRQEYLSNLLEVTYDSSLIGFFFFFFFFGGKGEGGGIDKALHITYKASIHMHTYILVDNFIVDIHVHTYI